MAETETTGQHSIIIRVAINRPIYRTFDYQCNLARTPEPGCRVLVPLGRAKVVGLVVEAGVNSDFADLKQIVSVLDETSVIGSQLLDLLLWASRYYCYPAGEVLFHALPSALRKGRKLPGVECWRVHKKGQQLDQSELSRAPRQKAVFDYLLRAERSADEIKQQFGANSRTILRELLKKSLVERYSAEPVFAAEWPGAQGGERSSVNYVTDQAQSRHSISLTEEQQQALSFINQKFTEDQPKPVLLHGITGSGKTEVYLNVLDGLLGPEKQALILVPEIGLTPQLTRRFRTFFPRKRIALVHSGVADSERLRIWTAAAKGALDIVIGTRSTVFLPFRRLGAIVIDEEHDMSFKQQEGFLYHARDLAIKRAHDASIPILLGSATPSLESLHNVDLERYHYVRIGSRPGSRTRPEMVISDIRTLPLEAGIGPLLMSRIGEHIKRHEQVMLYLNRRGFAPVLLCPDCGWHAICVHCERGMTYHAHDHRLVCHHCGAAQPVSPACPECGSQRLTTQGQGTERIEQILKVHFPATPVIRIDRDSTAKKGELEKKLQRVHAGEPVILVGTQMLTKGHDFPALTLVGVVDVDQALFSMDYRAHERLVQQVIQVSGRAGRGDRQGVVVLQTAQPEHPLLQGLLANGYLVTVKQILNERAAWRYPPFGAQALLRANALREEAARGCLESIQQLWSEASSRQVTLLGPVPSLIAKRAGRYRYQLLLSAASRSALHGFLGLVLSVLQQTGKKAGVRWSIDVDPQEFS